MENGPLFLVMREEKQQLHVQRIQPWMEDGALGPNTGNVPELVVGELRPELDHVVIHAPVMEVTHAKEKISHPGPATQISVQDNLPVTINVKHIKDVQSPTLEPLDLAGQRALVFQIHLVEDVQEPLVSAKTVTKCYSVIGRQLQQHKLQKIIPVTINVEQTKDVQSPTLDPLDQAASRVPAFQTHLVEDVQEPLGSAKTVTQCYSVIGRQLQQHKLQLRAQSPVQTQETALMDGL